jgi:hypothetical protein
VKLARKNEIIKVKEVHIFSKTQQPTQNSERYEIKFEMIIFVGVLTKTLP